MRSLVSGPNRAMMLRYEVPFNAIALLGNRSSGLREFAGNVSGGAVEIFQVTDIARREFD